MEIAKLFLKINNFSWKIGQYPLLKADILLILVKKMNLLVVN